MSDRDYAVKIRAYAFGVSDRLEAIADNVPPRNKGGFVAFEVSKIGATMCEDLIGELHPENEPQASIVKPLVVVADLLRHRQKGLPHDAIIMMAAETILNLIVQNYPR